MTIIIYYFVYCFIVLIIVIESAGCVLDAAQCDFIVNIAAANARHLKLFSFSFRSEPL